MTSNENESQPAPQTTQLQSSMSLVALDIKEKEICFILPLESSLHHGSLNLPGGALIQGQFSGTLICARGALVIAKGAVFSGYAEADEIYVAGEVGRTKGTNKESSLMGRTLIAVAESAVVHADLTARLFNLNNIRNVFGAIRTLA